MKAEDWNENLLLGTG